MAKLSQQLMLRLDEATANELNELSRKTHVNEADYLRALVHALLDYYRSHGSVTMPLQVLPAEKTSPTASGKAILDEVGPPTAKTPHAEKSKSGRSTRR